MLDKPEWERESACMEVGVSPEGWMKVVLEKRQVCLRKSLNLYGDFNPGNIQKHICLGEGVRSEKASNTRVVLWRQGRAWKCLAKTPLRKGNCLGQTGGREARRGGRCGSWRERNRRDTALYDDPGLQPSGLQPLGPPLRSQCPFRPEAPLHLTRGPLGGMTSPELIHNLEAHGYFKMKPSAPSSQILRTFHSTISKKKFNNFRITISYWNMLYYWINQKFSLPY